MVDPVLMQGAREIISKLEASGYKAYIVGGCVRDMMVGIPMSDIDIATSALPDDVIRLFPHTVPTGLQHGTVTVMMERLPYEVTTFRKESDYEQSRRPKHVEFIDDLTEDLRRRDFTMNAMAMDAAGGVVDPFGGAADLAAKRLRAVGEAELRFGEDALRMLRCIRFAAAFVLEIERRTWAALVKLAPALSAIAMERVHSELDKIVAGPHPEQGLRLLCDSGLYAYFKEETGISQERWSAMLRHPALSRLTQEEDPQLRWAALFAAMELDADEAGLAMRALKFSRRSMDRLVQCLEVHAEIKRLETEVGQAVQAASEPNEIESMLRDVWKRTALDFGLQAAADWLTISGICALDGAYVSILHNRGRVWISEMPVCRIEQLTVRGDVVAGMVGATMPGLKPGPWIGQLMRHLLEQTALERIPNEPEALLQAAQKFGEKMDVI